MLLRKMLRDMKLNIAQFISIFLMAILGVLVFTGINSEWYGMKKTVDKYYEETHLPDIWVMSDGFSKDDAAKVKEILGVSHATRRGTYDAAADLSNRPTLRVNIVEDNILSTPKIIKGDAFYTSRDGLWLDASFAKANHLEVGDELTFTLMNHKLKKTILGLIIHPEYVHNVKDDSSLMPDYNNFGFVFISYNNLPKDFKIPFNQLLITKNSKSDEKSISEKIENIFADRYNVILNRDTQSSAAAFQSEIDQNKAMGGVFPVVFFLIAALTMLTTMTRITNNQRTQIGSLKALGFSRRKILIHYVSYGLWIGLLGGIIGLFIGPLMIPSILFSMQKTVYVLPQWSAAISPSSFVAVVVAVFCCGASSYFACRKQLKEVPAAALRPNAPKTSRHTAIERSNFWHSLGFSVQWNLRDVMRSRIRSIMAIIGVTGCTALLIFGLGLRDTVNNVSNWMYKDLNIYESKINLKEDVQKEEIDKLNKAYKGQWIQESPIEIRNNGRKKNASLMVLDEGQEVLFQDSKRNKISLSSKGISLSYKMAEIMKLHVGETVEWRALGEKNWQKSIIGTIYRTPMNQGISMTKDEYEKIGHTFQPTSLLTPNKVAGAERLAAVKEVLDKSELINQFNVMLQSMRMIIVILVIAAAVLGSVVLYNLGALAFTERVRELATLKVLGFFPKQIRSLLQMQNIWLTIIGITVGIPTGYALVRFMLSTMPDSTDMVMNISMLSIIVSLFATFILSVLINLLLSRKVKSIDMVTSLKSVE